MKKVLLISSGSFHPPYLGRLALRQALVEMDGFEFRQIPSLEKLPGDLGLHSAIVLYIHQKTISDTALNALDEFVSNGGGLLGIHSATASFKQQPRYFEILGGQFTGHGKVEPFEIYPTAGSEIFAGIPNFTVKDELYLHDLQPGITVQFTAEHAGQVVPIVWTYRHGQGRVCYAVPGHRSGSLQHKTYQQVLRRGLAWVSGK